MPIQSMPESHTANSTPRRQFSIRTLVVLMCVVSGVAALFTQAGADMACAVLVVCIWCAFLSLFGGVRRFLLTGLLLGLVMSVIKFPYLTNLPHSVKVVLVPFGLPLLLLNVFSLVGDSAFGKRFSISKVDVGWRKVVAWKSLFALSLIPLAYGIAAVHDPSHSTSGLDLLLACGLVFWATAPWAVFWRRRRLAGYVFKKNWVDKLSWGIIGFAFLSFVVSAIPIMMVFAGQFVREIEISEPSRYSLRFFIISIFAFQLTSSVAPVLVMISWSIQWFRDRWWYRLNWLMIGWSILVFAAYLIWLKYFV